MFEPPSPRPPSIRHEQRLQETPGLDWHGIGRSVFCLGAFSAPGAVLAEEGLPARDRQVHLLRGAVQLRTCCACPGVAAPERTHRAALAVQGLFSCMPGRLKPYQRLPTRPRARAIMASRRLRCYPVCGTHGIYI